jgi:MFS family permease
MSLAPVEPEAAAPFAAGLAVPHAPPRGAWREAGLVFACTLGNFLCVNPTVTAVFGLVLVPIATDFHWPRARVSGGLAVLTLANAVVFPLAGRAADRFGARRVVLCGNLMLGLSIAALSLAGPAAAAYYGLFLLVGIAGALSSGMLLAKTISENFTSRRGLWLGFCAGVGNGGGSTVMPLLAAAVLAGSGWRGVFRDIGVLVIAVGFPLLFLLLHDLPAGQGAGRTPGARAPASGMTLGKAMRHPEFWMIMGAIAGSGGCMIAVFGHVVPILTDKGIPLGRATVVLSVFTLTCAAWQSSVGWLLDRTERPALTAPFYLVAAIGLLVLQRAVTLPWMIAAGAMLGVALGTEFAMLGYLVSRYFGVASFGAIAGTMSAAVLLAQAASPYLMDVAFDHTGSYALPLLIMEGAMVAAAAVIGLLRPYPLKITD